MERAALVAQMVKNLPAMQETQLRSLGQEDPLEKEMAAHSSIPAWRIPWTEEPGSPWGCKSWTRLNNKTTTTWAHRKWRNWHSEKEKTCLQEPQPPGVALPSGHHQDQRSVHSFRQANPPDGKGPQGASEIPGTFLSPNS